MLKSFKNFLGLKKENSPARLSELVPVQGDAVTLLESVMAHFPSRSEAVDLLAQAITPKLGSLLVGYQQLGEVKDYLSFTKSQIARKGTDSKVFLLVHPEQKGGRFVSIANHEDRDGLIGLAYSWLEHPAVNFNLVHQEGSSEEVTKKFDGMRHIRLTGSQQALNLVVDGKTLTPKTPRPGGEEGDNDRTDVSIVASLPLRHVEYSPDSWAETRETIMNAQWPNGWEIFGLSNVSAQHIPQERDIKKEQTPMTGVQIKSRIESYQFFIKTNQHERGKLLGIGNYPNIKDWEKARNARNLEAENARLEAAIERLQQSLDDPMILVTPADLGIQVWR